MSRPVLSQSLRIKRLYRNALKTTLNWAVDREIWYDEIEKVRGMFLDNAAVRDRATIDRLIARGEKVMRDICHPDPYIVPYAVGGSLYARNPPWPQGVTQYLDYGREKFDEAEE